VTASSAWVPAAIAACRSRIVRTRPVVATLEGPLDGMTVEDGEAAVRRDRGGRDVGDVVQLGQARADPAGRGYGVGALGGLGVGALGVSGRRA
jgi:hypothetical protein